MKKFLNLTPHAIVIRLTGQPDIVVPPSGQQARVAVRQIPVGSVPVAEDTTVPLVKNEYGPVEGLPAPEEDTVLLVSLLVLGRVTGRSDVAAPDTGTTAIRFADGPKKGQVEACVRLVAPDA